ncbi:hypothetical protein [Kitasatospora sp. GP82]|uniref:hypothetical protein n=1 Tax=Kitasatospora sp. GP82 TaxID=3035089 RepID=UPI00247692B1|nr:hypothetical protein [Kitasatospora sp. GP82]MDH6124934.1 hypothetical protein [Kitasatospora sp. GP82]
MTRKKTTRLILGIATAVGTVALGGAAQAATPGSAQSGVTEHVVWQAGHAGGVSPMHVPAHGFNTYSYDGTSWRATVTVDYGRTGAWTHCSDGTDIHGPLQGPGFWDFGGSCSGHGTITQYGWYDG